MHNSKLPHLYHWLPMHTNLGFRCTKLQDLGNLLLIIFSYFFFNLFSNPPERKEKNTKKRKISSSFATRRSLIEIEFAKLTFFSVRRSDSLIAHVFFCRRSCSQGSRFFSRGKRPGAQSPPTA